MIPADPPAIVAPVAINHPCLINAAAWYVIPPELLLAIRMQEGGTTGKSTRNSNGSYDHGPMQINTVNLKKFERYGIRPEYIRDDECTNLFAGAYLLRESMNRNPDNLWKAVGEYHSATPVHRDRYIGLVYERLSRLWKRYPQYTSWLRAAATRRRLEFLGEPAEETSHTSATVARQEP